MPWRISSTHPLDPVGFGLHSAAPFKERPSLCAFGMPISSLPRASQEAYLGLSA